MFMFQTLKYLPPHVLGMDGELLGVAAFGVAAVVLILIPFLDRPKPGRPHSPIWTWAAYGGLAYILILTYLGYASSG
jgi:quinol-cytochrome oxidoreductase complex cytochrome b subunit